MGHARSQKFLFLVGILAHAFFHTEGVPSSLILSTVMMEAIRSSETEVLTRVTRRHIPENFIPHSHGGENLKSCNNKN
jgi:hypothetical protein